jgi:hypothetical protein
LQSASSCGVERGLALRCRLRRTAALRCSACFAVWCFACRGLRVRRNSYGAHPDAVAAIQYNRRFVNVVVGLGKKKGPNSNTV